MTNIRKMAKFIVEGTPDFSSSTSDWPTVNLYALAASLLILDDALMAYEAGLYDIGTLYCNLHEGTNYKVENRILKIGSGFAVDYIDVGRRAELARIKAGTAY